MAAGSQRPSDAASDFDYWLRRCEGFRVYSPQGQVGKVEEVRYASRCDRPDVIAIRCGLLGRPLLIVPVGEVEEILPREERIVLHQSPRPTAPKRFRHWEVVGAGAKRIEAQREVELVIERLTRRIGLRFGRGGEPKMTPDVEASAEPPEEEQAEEPAVEEASVEAAPAEPAAEKPSVQEPTSEEQTTA
jgi:hypothetical protein